MKKLNHPFRFGWGLTLLFLFFAGIASAQTRPGGFIVQMTDSKNKSNLYFEEAPCGYIAAINWGAKVSTDLVAEAVWAKDLVGNDSLACDSIKAGNLTGKIAVIRRGGCIFTDKALRAQRAGAVALIIVMDSRTSETSTDGSVFQVDDCSTGLMGGGGPAPQITIPVIFMPRAFGKALDAGLKSGKVTIGFYFPRHYNATTAFSYATPVSQVDTLDWFTVRHANRGATPQTNVGFKVEITAPNGVKTTLEKTMASIGSNGDSLIRFPRYVPPAIKGKFKAVFTNSVYKDTRDTLTRFFEHTDYTWATDNFDIVRGGVGVSDDDFETFGLEVQNAGICWTGDKPNPKATHATFGLANAGSLFVPGNVAANSILVLLYDASSFALETDFNDIGDGLLSTVTYNVKGTEPVDALIDVALKDENGKDGVALETNFPYYVSLRYSRPDDIAPRMPYFTVSSDVDYVNFNGLPSTPLYLGDLFTGWDGLEVVQRLQLDGYKPTSSVESFDLKKEKLKVGPIPAADQITLQFDLEKSSKNVYVSISDIQGRTYTSQRFQNVQNAAESLDVKGVPSGHYVLIVHTDEGSTARKVTICH